MGPFRSPSWLPSIEPSRPRLETPIGWLGFHASAQGERLEPCEAFGDHGPISLRRYERGFLRVDLLLNPQEAALPPGMSVDGCVVAVWRVTALGDAPPVRLAAEWEPEARIEDGGIASGEHLFALTWDAPGVQVSLGTMDEEVLPPEFAEEAYWPRAVRDREGLELIVPSLAAGKTVQVHFVVAWKVGEVDGRDASTWFAVDVAPRRIATSGL